MGSDRTWRRNRLGNKVSPSCIMDEINSGFSDLISDRLTQVLRASCLLRTFPRKALLRASRRVRYEVGQMEEL